MNIGILGAGLAGLEAGRRLKGSGHDFTIFEKEPEIGGLCRTNRTGDYSWDIGVHAIYSRNREANDYLASLPLEYCRRDRSVKILHTAGSGKKYIIDYPFENGVIGLPKKARIECILGYVAAALRKKPYSNLQEWIDNRLGYGIAKHFMDPYNNKIWNCGLSGISLDLVNSKIEPVSAFDFIKGAVWKKSAGRLYQAKFIYPKKGIQALIDHTAEGIKDRILTNAGVERITKAGNSWSVGCSNGKTSKFDRIISTMPLTELLKKIDASGIKKEYPSLKWNDTFFVMAGLKKGSRFNLIHDHHWVFFKEGEIFYRVTLMHNFSDGFPPCLVAEVTDKGRASGMTKDQVQDLVITDLVRLKIIDKNYDIAQAETKRIEYTYPIPTVGLKSIKAGIAGTLEEQGVFLLGRSGRWDYINMDGVLMNVKGLVSRKFPTGQMAQRSHSEVLVGR